MQSQIQHHDALANSSKSTRHQYQQLPKGRWIRLLRLFPSKHGGSLECELFVVQVDVVPQYEAISYVWGDPSQTTSILCDNHLIHITANLHGVLRQIRHASEARIVWADAICIDQANDVEKGHQVNLMGLIYSKASRVLIWLGEDAQRRAATAFRFIVDFNRYWGSQLAKYPDIYQVPQLPSESPLRDRAKLDSVAEVFRRPWFSRVWTVQEVGLASTVLVLWGEASINWGEIVEFANICHDRAEEFVDSFDLVYVLDGFQLIWCTYDDEDTQTWKTELPLTKEGFQTRQATKQGANFFNVLLGVNGREATDKRDFVYAFLGHSLARLQGQTKTMVAADYTKEWPEVYWNVAIQLLEQTKSLVLLSAVSHLDEQIPEEFPSWIPQWYVKSFITILSPFPAHESFYDAALVEENSTSLIRDPRPYHFDGRVLTAHLAVRALIIDSVRSHSSKLDAWDHPRAKGSLDPVEAVWKEAGFDAVTGSVYSSNFEAFTHTLVAGMTWQMDPTEADVGRHRAAFRAYSAKNCSIEFNGLAQRELPSSSENDMTGDSTGFSQILGDMCNHRKCFITEKGYFGLGPLAIQEGDLCCVLFGARVPFIVRSTRTAGHYRLVGECFAHGLMRGEATRAWREGSLTAEEIFLV